MQRDMYKAVHDVLSRYMDTFPDNFKYSTWIVRLLVGHTVITECYLWDGSTVKHIWESDWWEGEDFVRILAAYPIDLLELPPYAFDCRVSADLQEHPEESSDMPAFINKGTPNEPDYTCTACGARLLDFVEASEWVWGTDQPPKYCPNCGRPGKE